MKDPLDQWAEGDSSAEFQGDPPGVRAAGAHGGPADHTAAGGGPYGISRRDHRGAIGEPVHVTGPLWQDDALPAPWETGTVPGAVVPGAGPAELGGHPGPGADVPVRYLPKGTRTRRRPKRRRPLRRAAVALLAAVLATSLGTYAWADTRLQRDVDLGTLAKRPAAGAGTNYLIVGSDSRQGLSDKDRQHLHTGLAGGRRTDSMILLHTGASGTTMMSLPRDSWVTLPGFTRPTTGKRSAPEKNKLNAAFSIGGPQLLVRAVERNTGLRIDHYAEIGFAGFVSIVDSVGGVPMCLDRAVRDEKSGADLKRGCQTLDGRDALAFVRQRHQEAKGDLGRTQNQQKFLSALAHRVAEPHTVLNPSDVYPALSAGLDTLIVDRNMSLRDLTSMFRAVQGVTKGHGKQINVPVSTVGFLTPKGSAVLWNRAQAKKLFGQLRDDREVTFKER